jgi:hypothetical protein
VRGRKGGRPVKRTKADKELARARGITDRVGRRAGLFVLFDEDHRGP